MNYREGMMTYNPPSFPKVLTTAHFLRVFVDINIGLSVKVLDPVGPWLQFSVFEDG